MVKILSQAGNSLADVYDVEGSIAGIDQLVSHELPLVHEMGGTVFSERLSGAVRRLTTGAILQTIGFDITIDDLPANLWRVLGIHVQADVLARTDFVQVSLRDPGSGREMPIFVWDIANDPESNIRIVENGSAVSNDAALVQTRPQVMPTLGIGTGQPQSVGTEIVLRGQSLTFGAGTVTITALVYLGLAQIAGTRSRGLPIPGW